MKRRLEETTATSVKSIADAAWGWHDPSPLPRRPPERRRADGLPCLRARRHRGVRRGRGPFPHPISLPPHVGRIAQACAWFDLVPQSITYDAKDLAGGPLPQKS